MIRTRALNIPRLDEIVLISTSFEVNIDPGTVQLIHTVPTHRSFVMQHLSLWDGDLPKGVRLQIGEMAYPGDETFRLPINLPFPSGIVLRSEEQIRFINDLSSMKCIKGLLTGFVVLHSADGGGSDPANDIGVPPSASFTFVD